jgi:hypothetical protein
MWEGYKKEKLPQRKSFTDIGYDTCSRSDWFSPILELDGSQRLQIIGLVFRIFEF